MSAFLPELSKISVDVFAVASMASVGLTYRMSEILRPLREVWGVILALVANFVAVPLLALLILRILPLETSYANGLLLVAAAAGAPFTIKLTHMAGGDVGFAAGVLVLLIVATIPYMPLVVPRLEPGVPVSAWPIARPLATMLLLPLALGLVARRIVPRAGRLVPFFMIAGNVALILIVVLTFSLNLRRVLGLVGTGAIFASVLFVIGAFAIGWASSRFTGRRGYKMGIATAQRNFGAALLVAAETFEAPGVLVMVIVVSLVTMVLLFPAVMVLNRYVTRRTKVAG